MSACVSTCLSVWIRPWAAGGALSVSADARERPCVGLVSCSAWLKSATNDPDPEAFCDLRALQGTWSRIPETPRKKPGSSFASRSFERRSQTPEAQSNV